MMLQGKVAVVTGAGAGLGRAIALRLAREGAILVLASRSEEHLLQTQRLIEQKGGEAHVIPTDVSQGAAVQSLSQETLRRLGRVDILINNVGIPGPTNKPLWEVSLEEWNQALTVNLTGTFLCCRAFLPAMVAQKSGTVIMIGSQMARNPQEHRAPYITTKLGLEALVKTLALETGPHGIRVNCIAPGPIEADESTRLDQVLPVALRKRIAERSALKRFVTSEEVASCVVFLASEAASGTTGIVVPVSAGLGV
jgi:NAD(P)-dependent dehydrogenase (short-subunit alcohol dehydrogenase family)